MEGAQPVRMSPRINTIARILLIAFSPLTAVTDERRFIDTALYFQYNDAPED